MMNLALTGRLAALLGLAAAAVTQAQPQPKFDATIECARVEREGGNGYEMSQCTGRAIQEADAQLNRVYADLRRALDADDQKALVAAQRAWVAWRDKEAELCARVSGFGPDGSGFITMVGTCTVRLTTERTRQLRQALQEIQRR